MNFNWEHTWKVNLNKYLNMEVERDFGIQIYSVLCQRYMNLCQILQALLAEHKKIY